MEDTLQRGWLQYHDRVRSALAPAGAGVLTIEAARYPYRVRSVHLRWPSGRRGGLN